MDREPKGETGCEEICDLFRVAVLLSAIPKVEGQNAAEGHLYIETPCLGLSTDDHPSSSCGCVA